MTPNNDTTTLRIGGATVVSYLGACYDVECSGCGAPIAATRKYLEHAIAVARRRQNRKCKAPCKPFASPFHRPI